MKPSTLVGIAILAALGYWAYKKYSTVVNLQFVPRGFSADGSGFHVILGVQNTSNDSLLYNSFAGTLYVNGASVANISDFTAREIVANAETDLPFTVTPNLIGLTSTVLDYLNDSTGISSVSIQGVANIGGSQYQVNVKLV